MPAPADTTGERAGPDGVRAGRRIRSRRELPSRRAAVGAVLVTASALITFAVATAGDGVPSTRYVVATRALEPGAVLRPTDLRLVPMDLPPEQAASALQDPGALDGAVLRGPLDGGALLTAAIVAPAAPGTEGAYREVSFAVPRARALLGELAPGDLVDVLASGEERTEVLVQRALVLSATDGTAEGLLVDDDVVITLALPTGEEALAVAHGAAAGELTVLRATRAEDRLPASYPTAGTAGDDSAGADESTGSGTVGDAAMSARFVVLGLARPRTPWFSEVGRWATSGSAPIEFIRCVSREEVTANLASGRGYSALLVDGACLDLDRDLVEDLRQAGSATIVVDDRSIARDWPGLGVHAVLPEPFSRVELVGALDSHAPSFDGRASTLAGALRRDPADGDGAAGPAGRWITVVGDGAGASVLAMGLAQAFADRRAEGDVVLADLALHADHAMLHAAPDIVPGISELVELHRGAPVAAARIRELTFAVDGRRYDLLLGLRRHRDWAALRPRALERALDGLARSYPLVVADCDADVEGEQDCGSVDVEERNALARAAVQRADVVVAVGTAELTGVHRLVGLVDRLHRFGIEPGRIIPVINRAPRQARARAELARAVGALTGAAAPTQLGEPSAVGAPAAPLFVPAVRRLDTVLRDGGRLPGTLAERLAASVMAVVESRPPRALGTAEAVAVRAGELGTRLQQRAAS